MSTKTYTVMQNSDINKQLFAEDSDDSDSSYQN